MFKKYNYYNEQLQIAADWEFNIKAIVINNCKTKHMNIPVVYWNSQGISNTNRERSIEEREAILNQLFPKRVISDLQRFELLENELLLIKKSFIFRIQRKLQKVLKFVSLVKSENPF